MSLERFKELTAEIEKFAEKGTKNLSQEELAHIDEIANEQIKIAECFLSFLGLDKPENNNAIN